MTRYLFSARRFDTALVKKIARDVRLYTMRDVESGTGVREWTLSKLRHGKMATISAEDAEALAVWLGCAVEDFAEVMPEKEVV